MLNIEDANKLQSQYPVCAEAWKLHMNFDCEAAFQKMIEARNIIPESLYAYMVCNLYHADTDGLQIETIKRALVNVSKESLMCVEDIKKLEALPDTLTVFRGTENYNEEIPRLSWSLDENIARGFGPAHLFKAVIPKKDIIGYFPSGNEEEIWALISSDFEIIY